jgi:hypothetical protein
MEKQNDSSELRLIDHLTQPNLNVCSQGKSGHRARTSYCLLMTRIGHVTAGNESR